MAFYNNNEEENQNVQGMNSVKPEQQEANATVPTQLTGGVNATSAAIPTGTQSQTSAAPKANSSGMTGFQNYQKANQGNATNKLAGAATQNVANQANQAKTNINRATTAFNQQVDQGSIANRENAVSDVKSAVDAARNLTAGSQIQQPQQSRFQEVINAKYQGPESLRQSGQYQQAQESTAKAQTAVDQAQSAQGREALLRNMYSQGGNYTQGLNKLDAGILNASGQGVRNLQQTAQNQGNIQRQLDNAQIASANLAQNRAQEIRDIRDQSRQAFTQGKTAEEAATEQRLQGVIDNWNKLPEYFKNIVRNGGQAGGVDLNNLEAAILGVGSGEGFYNLGERAIATGVADRERLISRDEQARQAALASLGALDSEKLLDTNLRYTDAAKAGTQSALDALDLAGTRERLNAAEQAFRDSAQANTLTGFGSKKNKSSGKRYYAQESANLGDLLKSAGYDIDGKVDNNNVGNADLLNAVSNVANYRDLSPNPRGFAGAVDGTVSPITNMGDGQSLGANYADFVGTMTGLNSLTGALGLGSLSQAIGESGDKIDDIARYNPALAPANIVGNALGLGSIGGAVSRIFGGGSNSRQSKAIAAQGARQDLERKVGDSLAAAGFTNRANVVDNQKTISRLESLQSLLDNLDTTNNKKVI